MWRRLTLDDFSLPGWPPAISHLGVLAFGVILAGLFRSTEEVPLKLPSRSVVMVLDRDGVAGTEGLRRGDRVVAVRRSATSAGLECALRESSTRGSGVIVQSTPRVAVAFDVASAREVMDAMDRRDDEATVVSVADGENANGLPRCEAGPRVVYGVE